MQWEAATEASLEEAFEALKDLYRKHLQKEPRGSHTTRRWVEWEERRLALEALEEALRKVQVMEKIRTAYLPTEQKLSLYEATLQLGYERGLESLNEERKRRGEEPLAFHGAYLAWERRGNAEN